MRTTEQVLDAYAEAKNRRDVTAAVALCHPDGYYESAGLTDRFEGHAALTAFYTWFFELLPDYRAEFAGRAIDGDSAVVWGTFGGTVSTALYEGAPLGARIEVPVTFVCTIRDGLIYSDTGYFDAASLYRQAGVPVPELEATTRAAAFVARFAERWATPDPERFRDLLDPLTRNLYPGMPEPQGPDGVVEWLDGALTTFPDLHLDVTRWAPTADGVLIEFDARATAGGAEIRWQGADRFTLVGDHCVEGRSYFDTTPLAAALGLQEA